MKIIDALIASLDLDAEVQDIRQGVFHTAVLTHRCGLAASLPRDALRQEPPLVKEAGSLLNKSARDLAHMAYSESLLEAALGVATINSLLNIAVERCLDLNAAELIAEHGKDKNVAIIGHFPFIPKLSKIVKALWVIEKNPHAGDFGEDKAEELLPKADVVAITGTALTNHTLEGLLVLVSPKAYTIMLGDSAPLSPILFDFGVDAVCGTRVSDPQLAMACVSQGANFRQIKGTQRLTLLNARTKRKS